MPRTIIGQITVENAAYATQPMVQKVDDMIYMARQGRKAQEIAAALGVENTQIIYHALQFFGLSIIELRAQEIADVMTEKPQWTHQEVADHLHVTLDALRNQIHYRRGKK